MKWKKIKKIKSINYFYIFFQTHLTYSNFSIIKLNNLKIYKFLTNFNYILFSFIIFIYSITSTNVFQTEPMLEPEKLPIHNSWFTNRTGGQTTVKPITS